MANTDCTGKTILLNELSKALNSEITEEDLNEAIEYLKVNAALIDEEDARLRNMRDVNIFSYIYGLEEGTRKRTLQETKDYFLISTKVIEYIEEIKFLSIVKYLVYIKKEKAKKENTRNKINKIINSSWVK